ncbi:MAG: hypothetical protein WD824_09570 [Cyclobacteriaceae bacterium]
MSHIRNHWLLVLLPVLGFSFWFLLGFPFADRNESYIWITYLQQYSFLEIIQNPIPSIRSFRPLAQGATWCLYQLSGANGTLVQLINFVMLCVAIWIMIPLTHVSKLPDVRLFYLMIGFIYFSAFYYIFNLHGIFYSVILSLIALFLKAQDEVLTNWKKWFLISAILTMFHPFILIFYVAYLVGWLIEKQQVDKDKIIVLGSILVVLFVLLKLLLPFPIFSVIDIQNLAGTMRNVETHFVIKAFTLILCTLTFLDKTRHQQTLQLAIIAIYLPLAIIYDLPFLFLLAFLIVLSLVVERKWSLAGLVVAAISFPLAVGSGAPTKACIFIFLLPYLLLRPLSFSFVVNDRMPKAIAVAVFAGIICCAALIRSEVKIPLLSDLISPILVEKGKTYQLHKALVLAQQQTPQRLIRFLQQKQANIREKGQPKQRDNFPPTKQKELDTFQYYTLPKHLWDTLPIWYIAFGTPLPNDTFALIYTLEEKNCKPAYIYEEAQSIPLINEK